MLSGIVESSLFMPNKIFLILDSASIVSGMLLLTTLFSKSRDSDLLSMIKSQGNSSIILLPLKLIPNTVVFVLFDTTFFCA